MKIYILRIYNVFLIATQRNINALEGNRRIDDFSFVFYVRTKYIISMGHFH